MEITIQPDHLTKLNPMDAVDLVRDLVQADAEESGIPPNIISFPSAINASDGGIDGKVDGADKDSRQGTIKKGLTCYQIKSGDYRLNRGGIKKLFGAPDKLKPEIKSCLENGTLVIVLTGQDLPTGGEVERINKHLGWKPSIEIWKQNQLIDYLKRYPKLCLRILKIRDNSFCYYDDWAGQKDMSHELVTGKEQDDFIAHLGQLLQSETQTEHIRVTGGHGIGKTRLVLEALRPEHLSSMCIYTCDPSGFMKSDFFKYLTVPGDRSPAILVVDECPDDDMKVIWSQINKPGNRIKLVTIYDRPSRSRCKMKSLDVPPLDTMHIKKILESYVEPQYKADIWYKECASSPHIAHIIGENMKSNPENMLREPETGGWDRCIAYRDPINNEEFERRKKVLLWVGQLRQFGYGGIYAGERKIIEDKIKKHTGMEKDVFAKTVKELMDMKILRGSNILRIEPRALHVWLWREWHREYDDLLKPFPLDDMWEKAQSDGAHRNVLEWYLDMWLYDKADSPHHGVKDVFNPDGFADRHALLDSYIGAALLYKMAKASPRDAVTYLERHIYALNMDGLRQFSADRQQVANILVEAAGCRKLFRRAARVLLLLAGPGSHKADAIDNMFDSLFLPASGPVGWTETPPIERIPMLKEALCHRITECRLAAIDACGAALQTKDFIKYVDPDEAWQRGGIWEPTRWTEYTEYYRKVLDTVRTALKSLDEMEQHRLSETVLFRTRFLLNFAEMHDSKLRDDILSVLNEMYDGGHADQNLMITTLSECLSYGSSNMTADLQDKLRLLHDRIVGGSYHGRMRRYIAMDVFTDVKMLKNERRKIMAALAKHSLDNPKDLKQELVWLVTDEATHGHGFGYVLGEMDDGFMFASMCDAQRQCSKSSATFLGGYLNAIFNKDVSEWDGLMDTLAVDPVLNKLVPALTYMSGMTDGAAARILNLVESKKVSPLTLRVFKFGTLVCDVPENIFQKWLGLLVNGSDEAYGIALNLYYIHYVYRKRDMSDSVHDVLFPQKDLRRIRHMSGEAKYYWSEILASYVGKGVVTEDVIPNVVDVILAGDGHVEDTELMSALETVIEYSPDKAWEAILSHIDPDKKPSMDARMCVKRLFSSKTLVEKITPAAVYDWIDENVERRAVLMAYIFPHNIKEATEYVAKYGDVDMVKDVLISNLETGAVNGSWLEHYRGKINIVDSILDTEDRPPAQEFLDNYREYLSYNCEHNCELIP